MNNRLLTRERLRTVCLIGGGSVCCRYIIGGDDGIECAKHMPRTAREIDRRVAAGLFVAQGDNCPGLPLAPKQQPAGGADDGGEKHRLGGKKLKQVDVLKRKIWHGGKNQ